MTVSLAQAHVFTKGGANLRTGVLLNRRWNFQHTLSIRQRALQRIEKWNGFLPHIRFFPQSVVVLAQTLTNTENLLTKKENGLSYG